MLGVVIVCRMSSSRLPGKTLMPFGEQSLLEHIVGRVEAAGITRDKIVICTSLSNDDQAILSAAEKIGCKSYAGSLDNVADRIIGAAREQGFENFLLVLGDNPWIDSGELRAMVESVSDPASPYDYSVTASPELVYRPSDERYYPIGTRIQYIRRAYMEERYAALEPGDASVREHVSRLFSCLPNGTRYRAQYPANGFAKDEVGEMNISINTREDYDTAVSVLNAVGDPLASTDKIFEAYRAL